MSKPEETNHRRIGVFICHCGTNIAHTVNVAAVVESARALPDVVSVREYKYMCSDPGQKLIKEDIAREKLDRVVVASCSPLMHEETFRNTCQDGGLNRFLFQMANIREQCSWVHGDRQRATEKAKRLVAAAVRRVARHRTLSRQEVPVRAEVLVVGAGIAGIEAALKLADAGKKVYLVEKEPSIGGHMAKFDKTFPTLDCAACILTPKMVLVGKHPNIKLLTYAEVEEVSGYVGNFRVKVRRKARYVEADKCTGCGQCVERCPTQFKPFSGNGEAKVEVMTGLDPKSRESTERAVALHLNERGPLIAVLQDINLALGYLPEEALRYVSQQLQMPLSRVYHAATFYKAFSLTPRGEYVIRVCRGTACHVRGSLRVLETLEQKLGIKAGQTTPDRKFTVETVNCLGTCAAAPVVTVNETYYGNVTPAKVEALLKEYQKERKTHAESASLV